MSDHEGQQTTGGEDDPIKREHGQEAPADASSHRTGPGAVHEATSAHGSPAGTEPGFDLRHTGRGVVMGLSDVVPGVSGGTMALLLGIHPRLVRAIGAIDGHAVRAGFGLLGAGRKDAWSRLVAKDIPFLMTLVLGIAAGILVGALTLERLLEAYPSLVAAAFLGLLVASVPIPLREVRPGIGPVAAGLAALLAAAALTFLPQVAFPTAWWAWPVAGAIAICAMILPGISGAFLLVLMGRYEALLDALRDADLWILGLFGVGGLIGILSFSRLLSHLLGTHRSTTMAVLTGLMVGSLGRVWPWRGGEAFGEGAFLAPPDTGAFLGALVVAILAGGVVVALRRFAGPDAKPQ